MFFSLSLHSLFKKKNPLKKEEKIQRTDAERKPLKMEAETAVMQLRARQQKVLGTANSWERPGAEPPSPTPSPVPSPHPHLQKEPTLRHLDFRLLAPTPGENRFLIC